VFARVESRTEYKQMMDLADTPRQGDLDGRGNLSERALIDFVTWFLKVALDQVTVMSEPSISIIWRIGTLRRCGREQAFADEVVKQALRCLNGKPGDPRCLAAFDLATH
jgi:hypothetical protein